MQVSIKWLKDYIDFSETPEEIADKLTMAGIPVENIIRSDEGLEKVVTGRLDKVEDHPDSDHMKICSVNIGKDSPLTIVTGAPNVREGQVVPVALIGANLPCGKKIAKGKLRGVVSMGMLCSADELCLDIENLPEDQKTGIYILPEDTPIGEPASEFLGKNDVVLEFELTANRGDCFSVFGIVREIAALTGNEPHFPKIVVNESGEESSSLIKIGIEAPDLCQRFSSRALRNVKIAPSPEWIVTRLAGAGIRAINNVVDVTNFVMIELGQPMHAYDLDNVKGGQLTARRAKSGENLHTLDDSSRLAKGDELVIADAKRCAGLAGVMGGLETEITEKTTSVVLEAASFNSASIRRTARACGLHSEASGRFERGVDVTGTVRALDRAAQLLADMGAATVCRGVVDVYPVPKNPVAVTFTADEINKRLGTKIAGNEMVNILNRLGFETEEKDGGYIAHVPSWRGDVAIMDDISEEIARIYGFDKIPATTPEGCVMMARQSERQDFIEKIKKILVSLGMDEEASFAFTNPSVFEKLNVPEESELRRAIPIMNPLSDDYPVLRTSLLFSVFENAMRNFSRKNNDVRLFEIAPVFLPKSLPVTEQPDETVKLAGILTGRRAPEGWANGNNSVDFFDVKGIMEDLFEELEITRYTVEPGEHFAMHPGKTALFKKGRDVLVTFGEVHPKVASEIGAAAPVYIFEADVEMLRRYAAKRFSFSQLPKYPAISRDLAVILSNDSAAADIERVIKKNAGPYFKNLALFDVYTGKQIEQGKKSLAFSITFQSGERTLTDEEADEFFAKIVKALENEFGAELRS